MIPDILRFVVAYAEGLSLKQCSVKSGFAYGSSAVDWASHCRDLFVQPTKFSGIVEVDESLFGRRVSV